MRTPLKLCVLNREQGFIKDFWLGGGGSIGTSRKHRNVSGLGASLLYETLERDIPVWIF